METTYNISPWRKNIAYLFSIIAVLVASFAIYVSVTLSDPKWLLVSLIAIFICFIFSLFIIREIRINSNSITKISLIGHITAMPLNVIIGYKMKQIRKNPSLLILVTKNGQSLRIQWFQLTKGEEILAWAKQNFRNMDNE